MIKQITLIGTLVLHLAVALFYAYVLFMWNQNDNALNKSLVIFTLACVFSGSSLWCLFRQQMLIFSLLPYALLMGVLVWTSGFRFSGVYIFTFLGLFQLLVHERRIGYLNSPGSDG